MSTINARCSPATLVDNRPAEPAAPVRPWLRRAVDLLLIWAERAHQRRQLQLLGERDLRDLGLTLVDVDHEAAKPFWRQ